MPNWPAGTVTFLFTDVEGSTRLLQQIGDEYAAVLTEYRQLLQSAVQRHSGHIVDMRGDESFVAFSRAKDAILAAIETQKTILTHPWPSGVSIRPRMGLHTGEPLVVEAGYVGLDVHKAARISAAGHGGQILISEVTRNLIADDLPQGVSLLDLGEHQLKDLGLPLRVHQVVDANLPADFPPLNSLSVFPNNLPVQMTSFVGRQAEKADVRRLLSSTRLLTLVGPGGTGKTRLALEVAADVLPEVRDGVWLVELAPLSDPTLIPNVVASALQLSEQPGRPLLATIRDHLKSRKAVLLFDNCEHLIRDCVQLADDLLRQCPFLQILATSRERLGIPGELAFPVPPLSLPDHSRPVPIEELMSYEATRLFVERARFALPTFQLTDRTSQTVVRLCAELAGVPLAIELAAARVRAFTVEQIVSRLRDRFGFLASSSPIAVPRHRTLRAAIDWSHDLLTEHEQTVFRRLSVFSGTFTLDAGESVCAGDCIAGDAILELLAKLVDKSLLAVDSRGDEARYRVLETIRQYAVEKLDRSRETEAIRLKHLQWYVHLAELAEPELQGPLQAQWMDRLEHDHDNFRSALQLAFRVGQTESGARLAGALTWFWFARGHLTEGYDWLRSAASSELDISAASRCKALAGAGLLANWLGDLAAAVSLGEEGLALCRRTDNKAIMGSFLITLGNESLRRDLKRSRSLFEEGLSSAREMGDRVGMALALQGLGHVARREGDNAQARASYEESLSHFRQHGDKGGAANVLTGMGHLALDEGDYERANALGEESLALFQELRIKRGIARGLHVVGRAAFHLGNPDRAEALHRQALALRWELHEVTTVASSFVTIAWTAALREQPGRAARLFGAAEALNERLERDRASRVHPTGCSHAEVAYEEIVERVKADLGESAFAQAWMEGRNMTVEQAVEFALNENPESRR